MRGWHRFVAVGGVLGLLSCRPGGDSADDEAIPADADPADRAAAVLAGPESAGAVHIVRMVARGDQYTFEPAELSVHPGEVVRFVQTGYQPQSIAFELSVPPEAREFLLRHELDSAPLLTQPGSYIDVSFADAPPGTYPFRSIPHAGRASGRIVVEGQ